MRRIATLLFSFLAVAQGYGQVDTLTPVVPDSVYVDGDFLVGERIIPDCLTPDGIIGTGVTCETPNWRLFPDSTILRGYDRAMSNHWHILFGQWDYQLYDCTIGQIGVNGFTYGEECYIPTNIYQVASTDSNKTGHIVLAFEAAKYNYADGSYDRDGVWDQFVQGGKLVIGSDTLFMKNGINRIGGGFDRRKSDIYGCGANPAVLGGGVCWPNPGIVLNTNDILNVKILASPVLLPPNAPAELQFWQHSTTTGSMMSGAVWLSWRIPVGAPDPLEQIRIEMEQGIHYEYRVLRDGDKEWKRFLLEDTRVGSVDEVRTLFGIIRYQRRKYLVTGLDRNGEYSFCIRAVNAAGASEEACNLDKITPVSTEVDEIPETTYLAQNYPNPFNPSTEIAYTLANSEQVRLVVYNMTGRLISVIADGMRPAGVHTARLDATGLPTGTYVYRLTTRTETLTRIMTLVR